jgi:DNA-binding transcriptional LysR family regulator
MNTPTNAVVLGVGAEGFDAAIRLGNLDDSNLVARRVASFGGSLVASPAYLREHGTPRNPEELLAHATVNRINDEWPLMHDGRKMTLHPRARFTADNGAALVPAVLAGLGIGAMTQRVAALSPQVVRVLPKLPIPPLLLWITAHRELRGTPRLKVVFDALAQALKAR